jgi:hypothetical protein
VLRRQQQRPCVSGALRHALACARRATDVPQPPTLRRCPLLDAAGTFLWAAGARIANV